MKYYLFTIVNKILITFVKIIWMMDLLNRLEKQYLTIKEKQLHGRYITMRHIMKSLFYTHSEFSKTVIGFSVQKRPVSLFTIGSGNIKILMWSQMHGNESTTTRAVVDLFNFLRTDDDIARTILTGCTLYCIPVLNPDGAVAYTRENANGIDINRDAQRCSQPESEALRSIFDEIKPHFCFNLHDQQSIYGVGNTPKSAVISFLSPLQDEQGTITSARKKSMELIVAMNTILQKVIPGHVARYYDTFNINCVGDTFQSEGVPTLLFEAGHFKEDYQREETRRFVYYALVQCLYTLSEKTETAYSYSSYFNINENKKTFFDILITHLPYTNNNGKKLAIDIGIQYDEVLYENSIKFSPIIKKSGNLSDFYGHKLLNYKKEKNINKLLKNENIDKIVAHFVNSYGK